MSLIIDFGLIGNVVFQLVLAAIGGIIGGSLTLLANRINARREQIKFAQEWYERQFHTEGIKPLTVYYTVVERILRSRRNEDFAVEPLPESSVFPVVAYNRLRELFPDNRFTLTVVYIEDVLALLRMYVPLLTEAERYSEIAQGYYPSEEELGRVVSEFRDGLLRIGADLRKQIHANVNDKNACLDGLPASQVFAELFEKKGPLKLREFLVEKGSISNCEQHLHQLVWPVRLITSNYLIHPTLTRNLLFAQVRSKL
jgi:hypothetical protein